MHPTKTSNLEPQASSPSRSTSCFVIITYAPPPRPLGARTDALQLRLLLLEPLLRERIRRVPARVHREVVRVLLVRRQRDVLAQAEHQVGLLVARIASATRVRIRNLIRGRGGELWKGREGRKERLTFARNGRPNATSCSLSSATFSADSRSNPPATTTLPGDQSLYTKSGSTWVVSHGEQRQTQRGQWTCVPERR